MALLNKEQILSAPDLTSEIVEVPEWGGQVRVRMLSALERDALFAEFFDLEHERIRPERVARLRVHLAALTLVDDDGNRLFNDEEIEKLGLKSSAAIERISEAAMRLNGLSAEEMQELKKN